MQEPAIREALEVESVFMKDDRERRAYEQREKALETAKSLIADGFDMDKISKYTGLSRAEIEKILQ